MCFVWIVYQLLCWLFGSDILHLRLHRSEQSGTLLACLLFCIIIIKTPWPESTRELYRPSDCRLSAKLVRTFVDRECHVVSVTDPYCRILGFLNRRRYFFFQVAPHLYSRGWVDPSSRPTTSQKINRTRDLWICSQELWPLDHRDGHYYYYYYYYYYYMEPG
jgi:hypothetical protein